MRFVDIHCHLIPDLDDGSCSLFETIEMLRMAHDRGTRAIVATPHAFLPPFLNDDPLRLHDAYAAMVRRLGRLGRNGEHGFLKEMALFLGAENCVSPEFLHALKERAVFTLNGGRYILIEFPPYLAFETAEVAVGRVLDVNLIPVLAHAERYDFFERRPERLASLRERGCVVQINAASIVDGSGNDDGLKGRRARSKSGHALMLCEHGLVDIVASDSHDAHERSPDLAAAYRVLSERFPEKAVVNWMWENPARILANRELVPWI